MSDDRVALELVVVGVEPTHLEPVRAAEEIPPLEPLLLAGEGCPRMCLALGAEAGGAVFFFLDALRAETLGPDQLARVIGEGRLHAVRPAERPRTAPALAAYARRYGIVPAGAGSHVSGRLIALAAAGRELRRLTAEDRTHAETLDLVRGRLERLQSEAAAEGHALIDVG